MKTFKNILSVAIANITSLGTSFIVGFILPSILSVADYGLYRQFILYISFSYLFNLGYNDGIYIKYGGKEVEEIDNQVVQSELSFIILFQLIFLILMLAFTLYQRNLFFLMFSIATFFITLTTYYQNFFQAIGKFKVFSIAAIIQNFSYILLLLLAIFIFNFNTYLPYTILYTVGFVYLFFFYSIYFKKLFNYQFFLELNNKWSLFKVGIFILIGNVSLTFIGNIGNWVVNFYYPIEDFAQYSFQNSILHLALLLVNAIGLVFFNVLSKNRELKFLQLIKRMSLLLGILSSSLFFIFSPLISYFLPQYEKSLSMLSMTFLSLPFIIVLNILIVNLYKTTRSSKKYFYQIITISILSFLVVLMTNLLTENLTLIALATSVTYMIFYLFATNKEFLELKNTKADYLLLTSYLLIFYISSNWSNAIYLLGVYLLYCLVILWFNRNTIKEIIAYL